MMKTVLLLSSALAVLCSAAKAQNINYVTYPNVYKFVPEYSVHQEKEAKISRIVIDSMRLMEHLRDSLDLLFIKHIGTADSAQLAQLEAPVNELNEKMERYQDFTLKRNWSNRKAYRETEIKALIKELEEFKPELKIIIAAKRGLVHCPDCTDLTEEFRQYMIKKYDIELTPWYESYEE